MSNVFSDYTEEQLEYGLPEGLRACDGMSALWYKPCCNRFMCLEHAEPFGSPECHKAFLDNRCFYNPQYKS